MIQHCKVAALRNFFFHLCTFVDKDILGQQTVFIRLAECLHPADKFRIGFTLIHLAVLFPWNRQEVLQVAFQGVIAVFSELMQTEWNQRLAVHFREFLLSHFQCIQEAFRCPHIRAADRFINILADYEGLIGYIVLAVFFIVSR
ncbi:hypothetical protein D3C73_1289720 [compost metagenome]